MIHRNSAEKAAQLEEKLKAAEALIKEKDGHYDMLGKRLERTEVARNKAEARVSALEAELVDNVGRVELVDKLKKAEARVANLLEIGKTREALRELEVENADRLMARVAELEALCKKAAHEAYDDPDLAMTGETLKKLEAAGRGEKEGT